jgi:hypothetical protein
MLPVARGELAEVVARYEDEKEDLGEEFLDEFAKVIERIRAWPSAARKVSRWSRQSRLDRFPYGVVYQVEDDTVVVLAVMYLGRKPGYWRGRESRP